jgi:hypothetical protein
MKTIKVCNSCGSNDFKEDKCNHCGSTTVYEANVSNEIESDHSVIQTENTIVRGRHNVIRGNNNVVIGSHNTVVGINNKVIGKHNTQAKALVGMTEAKSVRDSQKEGVINKWFKWIWK